MADQITVWSDSVITNNGLALRQKAIALGLLIDFPFAQLGEGVPSDPTTIPLMTSLAMFAQQTAITRSLSTGPTHHIDIQIDNLNYPAGIIMREVAIFARIILPDPNNPPDDPELPAFLEPVLYSYAYCISGYESIPAGSALHRIWVIGIDTQISRSTSITISYDASSVYVPFDTFNFHINQTVYSEEGVHGQRYWLVGDTDSYAWQVWDGTQWIVTGSGPGPGPGGGQFSIDNGVLSNTVPFGEMAFNGTANTLEISPGFAVVTETTVNLL